VRHDRTGSNACLPYSGRWVLSSSSSSSSSSGPAFSLGFGALVGWPKPLETLGNLEVTDSVESLELEDPVEFFEPKDDAFNLGDVVAFEASDADEPFDDPASDTDA